MFFLIGTRSKAKVIGEVELACPKCTRRTMQTAVETRRWLTLFFIPVIPLGSSGRVVRCNLCGLTVKGSEELNTQLAARAAAAGA